MRETNRQLHTQVLDDEIKRLRLVTDSMREGATVLAVLVGIRYAMREAYRRDRDTNPHPYGPACLFLRDIASASFCSLATVKRTIPILVEAGVLQVVGRRSERGDPLPSLFTLPLHEAPARCALTPARSGPSPQSSATLRVGSQTVASVSRSLGYSDTEDTSTFGELALGLVEHGVVGPAPSSPKTPHAGHAKSPLQLRVEALMRRRPATPLSATEQKAFSKALPQIEATSDDEWRALETYYAAPQAETFSRKDLATLLNNWNGEIDRAKAWVATHKPPVAMSATAPARIIPEPSGWRDVVARELPDSDYAPGKARYGVTWDAIPPTDQQAIMSAVKNSP